MLELEFSRRWQTNKIESDWSNSPRHSSSRQFRSPRYNHEIAWTLGSTDRLIFNARVSPLPVAKKKTFERHNQMLTLPLQSYSNLQGIHEFHVASSPLQRRVDDKINLKTSDGQELNFFTRYSQYPVTKSSQK